MEKKIFIILFFIFFRFDVSSADTAIDVKGFSSHIQAKLSEFGYLKELNEKYQIRKRIAHNCDHTYFNLFTWIPLFFFKNIF